MTEPFVSYAQHGEDVVLWRALGGGIARFYVDVGAFDPTEDSVTCALYERGWRGINIEAQASLVAAFERERPEDLNLCVAVAARDGAATLHLQVCPGGPRSMTPPRRVSAILETTFTRSGSKPVSGLPV